MKVMVVFPSAVVLAASFLADAAEPPQADNDNANAPANDTDTARFHVFFILNLSF
jgi:hypothetical protein